MDPQTPSFVAPGVPQAPAFQNTSGQGSSANIPPGIKGWSWGVCNGTFIALLMFVPVANIIMPFVLGAKGREWAWQNKRWDSVEEFNQVQKTWSIVSVVILLASVGLILLLVITGARFAGTVKITTVNSNGTVTTSNENVRQAADDARTEGMLDEMRNTAEIYYRQNNDYGAPTNSCESGMFADSTSGFNTLISQSQSAGFTPVCNSNGTDWAVSAPISTGANWCVDSTGRADQTIAPLGQAVTCS